MPISTRKFKTCPRCKAPLQPTLSFSGTPSEHWLECSSPKCNTYVNTFVPMPHQAHVNSDPHKFIGNFGAYGTGKTSTSRQEVYKHVFITPNANVLIGANIVPQYEQTIKREFDLDFPQAFVQSYSVQKAYYDIIGGARIIFRPFDQANKLRSYNLSMFVMIEASECSPEVYHQLKTRLRNTAATTPLTDPDGRPLTQITETGQQIPIIDHDWRKGIIESNPDAGWIRSQVLLTSDQITKHGKILDDYQVFEHLKDINTSSHVASTDVNAFLPTNYVAEISANKPAWWVARYVFGSFSYSEGLVYPSAPGTLTKSFEPPLNWPRLLACDYGLNDNFVYLLAAVDEANATVHVYQEYVTNNRSIEDLAKTFHEITKDIPTGLWYTPPILDPMSGARRDYAKKDLYSHFLEYGIFFQPGHKSLDARIYRLNTYIESGRLKIHDKCTTLIDELSNYKFPERTLDQRNVNFNKPVDKDNHCINPLEWIVMALPSKPDKLRYGAYDRDGNPTTQTEKERKQAYAVHALSDPEDNPIKSPTIFSIQGGSAW